MIRIIVQADDAAMASNVGGRVNTTFKTFDVFAPEIEAFIKENTGTYCHAVICGAEIVTTPDNKTGEGE